MSTRRRFAFFGVGAILFAWGAFAGLEAQVQPTPTSSPLPPAVAPPSLPSPPAPVPTPPPATAPATNAAPAPTPAPAPPSPGPTSAPNASTPGTVTETFARMDLDIVRIPAEERDSFVSTIEETKIGPLSDVLTKFAGKVDFSASTAIGARRNEISRGAIPLTNGEPLVYAVETSASDQIIIAGQLEGMSFKRILQPGYYQLLMASADMSQQPGAANPTFFRAILVRLHDVASVEVSDLPEVDFGSPTNVPHPGISSGPAALDTTEAPPPPAMAAGKRGTVLYENRGDNVKGFERKFGDHAFVVDQDTLMGEMGSGWVALPVSVRGNFQIEFDVYGDSNDVGSFLLLFDDATKMGLDIENCPQRTYTGTLSVSSLSNLTDSQQFYWSHDPLAIVNASLFPNKTWTHVVITRTGNSLVDNVGGQVVPADLSQQTLPHEMRVGLGFYATRNVGGAGRIRYANIRVERIAAK